jgi:cytochrome c peroxidase
MRDFTTRPIMAKPAPWLVMLFFTVVLCEAVYFIWLSETERSDAPRRAELIVGASIWQEPITPIPIVSNLDARKVALGRRLFFAPFFSRDNKTACAHCHNLATDGEDGLQHSISVDGIVGKINTPTVFNSGFNFRLFWDGRAATLEDQIEFPMPHASEMDATWPEVIAKLERDAAYRRDFADIYKDDIQPQAIKDAIATFVRSLTTPNSKFDRFLRGDKHALNDSELAGYELFKSLGCITCHQGRNVGGNMFERLGLVEDYFKHRGNVQGVDFGRYNITKNEADRYEFRVPSLRNVALTAPYFHDASASTLNEAVLIMGKYQLGVDLRGEEVSKIVEFLNTLTGEYDGKLLSGPPQGEVLR